MKLLNYIKPQPLFLLQISTAAVFLGRAYQHIFWEGPYRVLLWDEKWMGPLLKSVGIQWSSYARNPLVLEVIESFSLFVGLFFLVCVYFSMSEEYHSRRRKYMLILGTFWLLLLASLYSKAKFYHVGQFLEYALQFGSPALLLLYHRKRTKISYSFLVRLAIALTFICHGLYAFGYYPVPGNFMEMTVHILRVSDETAIWLLRSAGVVDFITAALLFFPHKKYWKIALYWMIPWGFFTALARIVAHWDWYEPLSTLHAWGFEFIYRFPHFLVPLALWLWIKPDSE